jgi:hypothetical protein
MVFDSAGGCSAAVNYVVRGTILYLLWAYLVALYWVFIAQQFNTEAAQALLIL